MARELASHLRLKPIPALSLNVTTQRGEGTGFSSEIETAKIVQGLIFGLSGEGTGFSSEIETTMSRSMRRHLKNVARELASHLRLKLYRNFF